MSYNAKHNRHRWHRALRAGSLGEALRIIFGVRPRGTPLSDFAV